MRDYLKLPILFLGAFAELGKAAISFVMSVCPYVFPHGATQLRVDGFSLNLISEFFKSVDKIQVSLRSDKINGYFK